MLPIPANPSCITLASWTPSLPSVALLLAQSAPRHEPNLFVSPITVFCVSSALTSRLFSSELLLAQTITHLRGRTRLPHRATTFALSLQSFRPRIFTHAASEAFYTGSALFWDVENPPAGNTLHATGFIGKDLPSAIPSPYLRPRPVLSFSHHSGAHALRVRARSPLWMHPASAPRPLALK
ncbi:hypothetical protein B0H14DRAFT_2644424 [Mycena olivaceomarginata]|nr:hypothetical protein B0H14DRAFT_2644424 [Mycena olivaceomarginata]